ncbi:MAG: TetR/AcrR family transcriptional regulator, partial [Candidatus Saccharibacteria bacterium]
STSRMERKKEETKQKIISVAMRLFLEQGVDATTMEQIAAEADIAKGTLYNYFSVKEAIIDEFIRRSFKEKNTDRAMEIRKLPNTHSRLMHVIGEMIQGVQNQPEIFEKYLIYRVQSMVSVHLDESERSGFHLAAAEIIRLGQESGEIRRDLPEYALIELFEYAFMEVVKHLFLEKDKFKPRKTIELYVDLCINGIKPNLKRKHNWRD